MVMQDPAWQSAAGRPTGSEAHDDPMSCCPQDFLSFIHRVLGMALFLCHSLLSDAACRKSLSFPGACFPHRA